MSTKYKKFRSLLLPKEMVDLLFLSAHNTPLANSTASLDDINKLLGSESLAEEQGNVLLEDTIKSLNVNKESEIIIGLAVMNDILSKSNQNRDNDNYNLHYNPMDSRYLKVKYGNDYKKYIHWLIINNIIWRDYYYKGRTTYYYLQSNDAYVAKAESLCRDSSVSLEDIMITYCLQESIEIISVSTDIKGLDSIRKNRIYNSWYKIKIPITKTNMKYLTRDYEVDSVYINNAPTHIKKMGSYYRKNLKIDLDGAMNHATVRYMLELDKASTPKAESSAFNRYSSRVSSINSIHNGRINKSLRFKRNGTNNRLDTNLTNMASDLRPFIIGYDKMAYLDLSNSQPVLFNILLHSYKKDASAELKIEIDRYFKITTSGQWYEWLQGLYNLPRDECKKIWMYIAYSKNESSIHIKNKFKKVFPLINSIIEDVKKEKHADLAVTLQKIESEIFIDDICKALVSLNIIPYTMHDGLLVSTEHQDKTFEIMSSILNEKIGAVPNIKIENYKPMESKQSVDVIHSVDSLDLSEGAQGV